MTYIWDIFYNSNVGVNINISIICQIVVYFNHKWACILLYMTQDKTEDDLE